MKILYKFASRTRPEKFFKCLDNIIENALHDNYVILCSIDTDDDTMHNHWVFQKLMSDKYSKVLPMYGLSKNKVHAINRDIEQVKDWDILINMSDDMWFVKNGFDVEIIKDMLAHFPDMDGVLHYNDGNKYKAALMTMSIMGKVYFDRDGYIYNPEYVSLWCDNEAQEVARLRNRYRYMGDAKVLFNHNHPSHKNGLVADALLKHTESFFKQDKVVYDRRKSNNFYL